MTTNSPIDSQRLTMRWLAIGIVITAVLHCGVQFLLYRGRAVSHWQIAEPDIVVFLLPNCCAVIAYAFLIARWVRASQLDHRSIALRVVGLTLVIAFLSFWASVLLPFNIYGT